MAILREFDRKCQVYERHANILWTGNTTRAAIYPAELRNAVCRFLRTQLELDYLSMISVPVVGDAKDASMDSLRGATRVERIFWKTSAVECWTRRQLLKPDERTLKV